MCACACVCVFVQMYFGIDGKYSRRDPCWREEIQGGYRSRVAPSFQLTRITTRSGTNVAVDESSSYETHRGPRGCPYTVPSCHGYRTNNNTAPPFASSGAKRQLIDSLSLSLCLSLNFASLLKSNAHYD